MKEVFSGRPETEKTRGTIIDFEAAKQKRQTGEKSQRPRPVTPPPSQESREERYTEKRQAAIREELGRRDQPKGVHEREQASGPTEDTRLFDELFGGQTEEEINAHNEQFKARKEREQAEKAKLHDEMRKQYTKYQEDLAAMSPAEREAWEKRVEKIRTPVKPLTPEEWKQLFRTWAANIKRGEREKAAWIAERDPRYDPMTGDLLQPDEFPLDAKAEYYFDGRERPRRFIPPDSPHIKDYKPLETDREEEASEGDYRDRLVNRLRKAGFTEVEPTLTDKVLYEKTRGFKNLPPDEQMDFLQEVLGKLATEKLKKEDTTGEKVAKFIEALFDFLIALISPEVAEEMQKKESEQKAA